MTTRKIKISQLTELTSASLNTTLVGVDNGVTYKMELDTLADAITSAVNTSDRSRISALEAETGSYLTSLPSGLVSESIDLTQINSFTESIEGRVFNLESATGSYLTSLDGTISSSQQITDFGFISESAEIPLGTISGSSQLTSSFDERYTLSGSVQPLPSDLVSGSSQLTSSFDERYLLSSSYSTDSASFDSRFNGLVTTGSNTFSGSQVFSGSMTVTSGQVIASTITNNSSSLFLQSGSNLYVQNDGIVEITGSLKVNGTAKFETAGGDEGGEIQFGIADTNTTLSTIVVADIFQNRFRIFEGGGNNRGVFIDLSKTPNSVGGEIMWKSSGIVDAGTFVTLDNIKATVPTSGDRGLSLATTTGSITYNIGGTYGGVGGAGGSAVNAQTLTTTPTSSIFGWNFAVEGELSTYVLVDKTNNRIYRITLSIGPAYLSNFISIERLH